MTICECCGQPGGVCPSCGRKHIPASGYYCDVCDPDADTTKVKPSDNPDWAYENQRDKELEKEQ